jgi:hypothetical protein
MKLFVALALVAVASAATLPVFPDDWSAIVDSDILLNQGGVTQGDYVCCDPEVVGQCKVQAENIQAQQYFSWTNNATRMDGNGQVIVDFYAPVWKEVLVDPATMACQSWCPIDQSEAEFDRMALGKKASDMGPAHVQGVDCELYWWEEWLLIIPMESINMYLIPAAAGEKYATPVREEDTLTPFGQYLGTENTTYSQFKAGPLDPKLFAVTGMDTCKQDPQCGKQNSLRMFNRLRNHRMVDFAKMFEPLVDNEHKDKYGWN